jgi:hypothetical protein
MAYSLLHDYVQNKHQGTRKEGTSINEMQTILHTVHTSTAEKLPSKSVTPKTKHLVTQMLEDGYEEECKEFTFHAQST